MLILSMNHNGRARLFEALLQHALPQALPYRWQPRQHGPFGNGLSDSVIMFWERY